MNISEKILPQIKDFITDDMETIKPNELSHVGLSVPGIVFEYGKIIGKLKTIPFMGNYMLGSLVQSKKSYKALKIQPKGKKVRISDQDLDDLLDLCKTLNIDGVGFTKVDPSLIFKNQQILFDHAIVLTMEMKAPAIKIAPSLKTNQEIFRTYYELGVAVNKITDFLKLRGYKAEAGPAIGGEANYPVLAEKAGLGCIGKHGLLITKEFGPSLRIAAVYTEIDNLPVNIDNEYQWIKEFCNGCGKCVRKCPGQAIYKDTKIFSDDTEQHIDYTKCAMPFSNDYGCTICIRECTFFGTDYEKMKEKYLSKR